MAKISEEDRQIHEDERIQALGGKVSYCPFGCKSESDDLDDHGYCRHLVGFTNGDGPGAKIETIQKATRKDHETKEIYETGDVFVSGVNKRKKINHMDVVREDDKIINPEYEQRDKGLVHMAKTWVSSRVYRNVDKQNKKAS